MRWFLCHSILLISVSVIITAAEESHPKQKRDLAYVKSLIKSAIFGSDKSDPMTPVVVPSNKGNYKIFKIPGFNKVLVKAIPKVAVAKGTVVPVPKNVGFIAKDPTVALVSSYLGTKTSVETLNALEGLKNLLESGILTAPRNSMLNISQSPYLRFISAIRNTESLPIPSVRVDSANIYAGVKGLQEPVYPLPTFAERAVLAYEVPKSRIPIAPSPMIPVTNIVETFSPVQVQAIPALPIKYAYKQIHDDKSMTSYTANDDHNVIVTKSDKPLPLPPFMAYRLGEVLKLGSQMVSLRTPIRPISRPPAVTFIDNSKVNPHIRIPQAIGIDNNYSYKQIYTDGTMTGYSSSGLDDSNVQVVTGVNARPAIPEFITGRVHNVIASTVSDRLPNPIILASPNVTPNYVYNSMVSNYPMFDTKGQIRDNINSNLNPNQYINTKPAGAFSYQTVHNDGSVTVHTESGAEENEKLISGQTLASPYQYNPLINRYPIIDTKGEVKVTTDLNRNQNIYTNVAPYGIFPYQTTVKLQDIYPIPQSPSYISHRIANISKINGDSFSYKIVHSNGTITNYGVPGPINDKKKDVTKQQYLNSNPEALDITTPTNLFSNKTVYTYSPATTHSKQGQENKRLGSTTTSSDHVKSTSLRQHSLNYTANNVKLPSGSFSYKLVHSDTFNDHIPIRSTVHQKLGTRTNNTENNNASDNRSLKVEATSNNHYVYVSPTPLNVSGYVQMAPSSANGPIPIKSLGNKEQKLQEISQKSTLSSNPIVVLDEPMSYFNNQNISDGSDVEVSNQSTMRPYTVGRGSPLRRASPHKKLNRGDIPDLS